MDDGRVKRDRDEDGLGQFGKFVVVETNRKLHPIEGEGAHVLIELLSKNWP